MPYVTSAVRPVVANLSKTTSTDGRNAPAAAKLTIMNQQSHNPSHYERVEFTLPPNSDDDGLDGDDEAEDNNNNNNTVNDTQQAIVLELPTNSDDETQDEDVDQSITDLMEKHQQMYVIREFEV